MSYQSNTICSIVLVLSTILTVPANAGINEWTSQGPYGGSVHALAIDPNTPATIYAASFALDTAGGTVFKSTDGGGVWAEVYPGGAAVDSGIVLSLAIDPVASSTVYAGNS